MMINFNVEETVRKRKSIRSYENRPLTQTDRETLLSLIEELQNGETPFPAKFRIQLLEAKPGTDTEKLGTYGVIRGVIALLGIGLVAVPTGIITAGFSEHISQKRAEAEKAAKNNEEKKYCPY